MSPDILTAALGYAQRGWPVLPLHTPERDGCSCKRANCTSVGKHPRTRKGLSDATTNQGQIRTWWAQWPDANIGILTGGESGLLVVDVDNKGGKNGSENLAVLASQCGGLPPTLTASTGNGEHLFFNHPSVPMKNSASKIADGVDVRAERGYVVAAPSLHASGKRYAWRDAAQKLADVPAWLLANMIARPERENAKTMKSEEHNPFTDAESVSEGERNDTLYKLGCALRGKQGQERSEINAILCEYNAAKCNPPLDTAEVMAIVESVCKYPPQVATNKSGKRLEENPLYWFQFNTREWFADQNLALMNDAQTGWYIRLKAFAWCSGGFLPADHDKLWKLAKARSKKAFERDCQLVLTEYVPAEMDGESKLKNPAMAAKFADTLQKWMQTIKAGEASKAKRFAALQSLVSAPESTPVQ